ERERRTLDALLALPVGREEILAAKWWGSLLRHRRALAVFGPLWLLALIAFGVHWLALPALLLASAAHLAFSTSAGLWLSVVCRSGVRALTALAGLALGLVVGVAVGLTLLTPLTGGWASLGSAFWPPVAWLAATRSDGDDGPGANLAGVLVCLLNAALFAAAP